MSGDDGFLSRWSRRKALARDGAPAPEAAAVVEDAPVPERGDAGLAVAAPAELRAEAAPPAPTLDDVARLTPDSDFSRFVGPGVDPTVSRAALKTLFRDPRFNVMDGLDTYIDDYGRPDPIAPSALRRLAQARALGLFADAPEPADDRAAATAAQPAAATAPAAEPQTQAPAPARSIPCDDDADLRLQPDDAARRQRPGAGPLS